MRLAIAHGSPGVARALQRALQQDGEHEVLWTTQAATAALGLIEERAPELLLLDVAIDDPGCIDVTRHVMSSRACAVLLLADRPQSHMGRIYEAMGLGALDVTAFDGSGKPGADAALRAKLRTVAKILGLGQLSWQRGMRARRRPLVAIGASTGGPQALFRILSDLPRDLAPAIVIVQHVDREFSVGLAEWLQEATPLQVALAKNGSTPTAGHVLLATSDDHLIMTVAGTLAYTSEPEHATYRPSIDVLFQSLAQHSTLPATAVLLTGMGRDGALGLKALHDAGWHTIAQDEASSVVFGMPKAAIDLGATDRVVSLEAIASAIAAAVR